MGWLNPLRAQQVSQARELTRGRLRDLLGGGRGAEGLRLGPHLAEQVKLVRVEQILEGELVDLFDGVGEVGVHLDGLDIAHDQERGILQRLAIAQKLLVGAVEVGVLALVWVLPIFVRKYPLSVCGETTIGTISPTHSENDEKMTNLFLDRPLVTLF
jgi:hypothetical protein